MTEAGVPKDEAWMARMVDGILVEEVILVSWGILES